jgi:hypothetical protein
MDGISELIWKEQLTARSLHSWSQQTLHNTVQNRLNILLHAFSLTVLTAEVGEAFYRYNYHLLTLKQLNIVIMGMAIMVLEYSSSSRTPTANFTCYINVRHMCICIITRNCLRQFTNRMGIRIPNTEYRQRLEKEFVHAQIISHSSHSMSQDNMKWR